MSIWEYLLLFASVIIGGIAALLVKNYQQALVKLIIPFTGAYIMGITVLHLMPIVFSSGSHQIGLFILLGFFIQIGLEQLSLGIEHGHIHAPDVPNMNVLLPLMIGLGIHSFLEGIPLSIYPEVHESLHHHEGSHNHLLFGVILHKAPAAFALTIILQIAKFSRTTIAGSLIAFGLMSPLGAYVSTFFNPGVETVIAITAVIVGLFLHISTTIIFEADDKHQHRISLKKIIAITSGLGLALLTML